MPRRSRSAARCLQYSKRVLGPEHPGTLTVAANLAVSLSHQGKHVEAEQINREVHAIQSRLLGPEHPGTLNTAANLACTLFHQHKFPEAQQLLEATLNSQRRVLGPAHPSMLNTACSLENMRSHIRAGAPPAATGGKF